LLIREDSQIHDLFYAFKNIFKDFTHLIEWALFAPFLLVYLQT